MLVKSKKNIRDLILEQRLNLTSDFINKSSELILDQLKNLNVFKKSDNICLYLDYKNEVKTLDFIKNDLAKSKKNIIIPKTFPDQIKLYKFDNIKNLKLSSIGIWEPIESALQIDPNLVDLFIVPGIAFDERGYRIGSGLGYYDKLLVDRQSFKIALAYDFQILPEIPFTERDQRMDVIISEKRQIVLNPHL